MAILTRKQQTRIDETLGMVSPDASDLGGFDSAVAQLEPAERHLALLQAGRRLRLQAERLLHLQEVGTALEHLATASAYRGIVLDVSRTVPGAGGRACIALLGQPGRLEVGVLPGIAAEELELGEEVEVVHSGPDHYAIRRRLGRHTRHGSVARIERVHSPDLLEVRRGPECLFLRPVAALAREIEARADAPATLLGQAVSFDESLGLAFGFFGSAQRDEFVLSEWPDVRREDLVLVPSLVRLLEDEILLPQRYAEQARRFGTEASRFFIFEGPPGVGKTETARWIASEQRRPVYLISGGELADQWYGMTEAALCARLTAAENEPGGAVVIWDEADAMLLERGKSQVGVEDRLVSLMLTFSDGFRRRGDVLMILTTNLAGRIDSALKRSLRAQTVEFGRPDGPRTRALFERFLRGVPCVDTDVEELSRSAALSVFDPREPLAEAVLRDSSRHAIPRSAAISGALVRAACERARRLAFVRSVRMPEDSVEPGIRADDLLLALDEQFAAVARNLSLESLPRVVALPEALDGQIVSLARRKTGERHKYYRDFVAAA